MCTIANWPKTLEFIYCCFLYNYRVTSSVDLNPIQNEVEQEDFWISTWNTHRRTNSGHIFRGNAFLIVDQDHFWNPKEFY